jgi:hypothetical protein
MANRTEGHRLLERWMTKASLSRVAVARLIDGVTPQAVSMWFSKGSAPDAATRLVLEIVAKIPAESWLSDGDRKRVKAARKGVIAAA